MGDYGAGFVSCFGLPHIPELRLRAATGSSFGLEFTRFLLPIMRLTSRVGVNTLKREAFAVFLVLFSVLVSNTLKKSRPA